MTTLEVMSLIADTDQIITEHMLSGVPIPKNLILQHNKLLNDYNEAISNDSKLPEDE